MVEDMRKTAEGIFMLDALYKKPERAIFINQSFSGEGFRRVEASSFEWRNRPLNLSTVSRTRLCHCANNRCVGVSPLGHIDKDFLLIVR